MKAAKKQSASTSKDKLLSNVLQTYRIPKGQESTSITHTRIGNQEMEIFGGKFNIPDDKYAEFLQTNYYRDVFVKNQPEYLTEVQLEKGPILVDVDLRHDHSVTTRQYTPEHIADLNDLYLDIFKKSFQLDDDTVISAYVFQKPTVNRVEQPPMTKDGVHIIYSVMCDHVAQQLIRNKILDKIANTWGDDLNITNTWDKVFDEGISKGTTNWQLVGSRKPGNDAYRLTGIFTSKFDSADQEFSTTYADASTFDMAKNIYQLSARYPNHYEPFMTNSFLAEHKAFKSASSPKAASTSRASTTTSFALPDFNPLEIRTQEQLDAYLKAYLESLPLERFTEMEAHEYVMTLPPAYYDKGSYDKWFQVGCALRNISNALFIVWLAFSAQSSVFSFNDVGQLWDQWQRFDHKNQNGLTLRSIMYWSKIHAPEKYKAIRENSVDHYLEQTLDNGLADCAVATKSNGSTDWDIARVLHQLKKDQYICSSIKGNLWYQFKNHRWDEIDSGTTLRMAISTELRSLYYKKMEQLNDAVVALEDPDDPKAKYLTARRDKTMEIYMKLGRTNDKKNIMQEARDMFYDPLFDKKLDTNQYLLCCTNGVWDFKEGIFRDGRPEDYISMCTNLEYVRLSDKHTAIRDEINDFMAKLFPVEELRTYMMDHLSSTLVGTAVNQTFNNYIGGGRNGKSVLVTLMTKTLGDYKGELPLTAVVTTRRVGVGGVAPEILKLKGKRYAVMQEPRQGDVLNEGILKELTSGYDAIQARGLYGSPVTFVPQFKLVVCANVLPEIKAQDHGTWRRIRVVPFMSLFTEEPVEGDPFKPYQYKLDSTIDEKFDTWKTVFLSMMVERVLSTNGKVVDCETVLQASNEYKQKQDVISQFIDERIVKDDTCKLKPKEVGHEFTMWHKENYGTDGPKPKELHDKLDKMFGLRIKGTGWRGIKLIYDNDGDGDICADEVDM